MKIIGMDHGNTTLGPGAMIILEITGDFKAPVPNDMHWKFVKKAKL